MVGIFFMEKEIWKNIIGYEEMYLISNLGNVKSLSRKFYTNNGGSITTKERILKKQKDRKGYEYVNLYKNNKMKSIKIHRLVLSSFVGNSNLSIDHINGIKSDNRIENLEYVSQRENNIRHILKTKDDTFILGTKKHGNKWRSSIQVNNKKIHLGLFNTRQEAGLAYKNYLKKLQP